MNKLYLPNFNLYITLLGGQAFGWDFDLNTRTYTGVTNSAIIKIVQEDEDYIFWQTYPKLDDYDFLSKYLRLDVDYENILKMLPNDEYLKNAIETFPGLRLLDQDFEETLFSYICSSTKSIAGIRQCVRHLSKKFGEEVLVNGEKVYLFPKAQKLNDADISDILECKVGFRAKYLKDAARKIVNGDFDNISSLKYEEAKKKLIQIRGVGDKVADCVLLYSLKQDHVTPLDVWGKRFLTRYYGLSEKMKYEDMSKWATKYFNGYAGWGGQLLFEYIRKYNK